MEAKHNWEKFDNLNKETPPYFPVNSMQSDFTQVPDPVIPSTCTLSHLTKRFKTPLERGRYKERVFSSHQSISKALFKDLL